VHLRGPREACTLESMQRCCQLGRIGQMPYVQRQDPEGNVSESKKYILLGGSQSTHVLAQMAKAALEVVVFDRIPSQVAIKRSCGDLASKHVRPIAITERRTTYSNHLLKSMNGPVELIELCGNIRSFLEAGIRGAECSISQVVSAKVQSYLGTHAVASSALYHSPACS
jgi:hypothetical protein